MTMKHLVNTLLIVVIIMMTSCTGGTTMKRELHLSDTLYTAKAAMKIYDYNPTRALLIIDSAEIVGNMSHDRADYYRAKIFTMTLEGMHLDSAQIICQSLMNSDYVKTPDNKESVLDLLIAITRRNQDYEQWLKWSTEKVELCRKYDNEVEALRTEAEIGVVLAFLGREDEGLKTIDNVIKALDNTRKFSEMDACIIALRRKVDLLQQIGQYEAVIPVAEKIIEKTNDYEQHPSDYNDGSYREPSAANVPDYCSFYRVKAYAYLAKAYAETDDIDNARHYLKLFEQSRYGQTFDGRMMISTTWCKLGDYDKMLAVYDEAEKYMNGDTINENYATILHNRSVAAEARGQYRKAYEYTNRAYELNKLLNSEILEGKAHDYAARYRAQEQQMAIDRFTMQNRMQKIIIIVIFVALVLTVLLYNHTVFQKMELSKKNLALVKMIDESIKKPQTVANATDKKISSCLSKACTLLREQPEMTVVDVAKEVGLTPHNLQKLFREQYGISLREYINSHQTGNVKEKTDGK